MKYSSEVISKTVVGSDGIERLYKARKMQALTVVREGIKLTRAIAPAIGSAADAVSTQERMEQELMEYQGNTFGSMIMMLSTNLTEDHLSDLLSKVMGSLMLGDEDIGSSEDKLNAHFDKHQGDFIEVATWLLKSNFINFLQESVMFRSLTDKIMTNISPKLKETISKLKIESSEELNSK